MNQYPPGNDHISRTVSGTFESMIFPFPVWWDMYPFPGGYTDETYTVQIINDNYASYHHMFDRVSYRHNAHHISTHDIINIYIYGFIYT